MVGRLAIFNIRGGNYRLIVRVEFAAQRIYVKEFLTHGEYDRKAWMKWL
jgi:mRNA interferase HigB